MADFIKVNLALSTGSFYICKYGIKYISKDGASPNLTRIMFVNSVDEEKESILVRETVEEIIKKFAE